MIPLQRSVSKLNLTALSLFCFVLESAAGPPQDLPDAVPPTRLPYLYKQAFGAFKETGIADLRSKAGEVSAIRLFCLNDLAPSYAFSIVDDGSPSPWIEWFAEPEDRTSPKKTGRRVLASSAWAAITKLAQAEEFMRLPCASTAVSVGHPYILIIEVFTQGTYRVIYRDSPEFDSEQRELGPFNRLTRQIVEASGIESFRFKLGDKH